MGGGLPDRDARSGQLSSFTWMIDELPIGEDPTRVPGIFQTGSTLSIGGVTYRCDRVRVVEQVNDTRFIVASEFSTDGRFTFPSRPVELDEGAKEWSITYKKVDQKLRYFVRAKYDYADGEAEEWLPREYTIPLEYMMVQITVSLVDLSAEQTAEIIRRLHKAKGRAHKFPLFGDDRLVMMPTGIIQSANRLTLNYAWESDPGNGPMGPPFDYSRDNPDDPDVAIMPPARPSYFGYVEVPAQTRGGRPQIHIADLFPPTYFPPGSTNAVPNPYYDPDGWRDLPGNPV